MLTDKEIRRAIAGSDLILDTGTVPMGHFRIVTNTITVDGSGIVLFVARGNFWRDDGYTLTDFGMTIPVVDGWDSEIVSQTVAAHGAKLNGDAIELDLNRADELLDGIERLAQACYDASMVAYPVEWWQLSRD